ncbi:hypothetical protein PT7_0865 [Pusillimonas sp. T7-7]|nr:hypothetical protein PT7_0865 [Pusillimonas sp. T7-7]
MVIGWPLLRGLHLEAEPFALLRIWDYAQRIYMGASSNSPIFLVPSQR